MYYSPEQPEATRKRAVVVDVEVPFWILVPLLVKYALASPNNADCISCFAHNCDGCGSAFQSLPQSLAA